MWSLLFTYYFLYFSLRREACRCYSDLLELRTPLPLQAHPTLASAPWGAPARRHFFQIWLAGWLAAGWPITYLATPIHFGGILCILYIIQCILYKKYPKTATYVFFLKGDVFVLKKKAPARNAPVVVRACFHQKSKNQGILSKMIQFPERYKR